MDHLTSTGSPTAEKVTPASGYAASSRPRTSHSYYVVMIDYGKRGREAIVDPEKTRRDIVDMLRSGESKHVNFIHHVDGLFVEDVTDELFNEAEALMAAE